MGYPHLSGDCSDHHSRVINWGGVRHRNTPVVVPKGVITLCGSSRFKDDFESEMKRLTLEGYIVISLGLFGHLDASFDVGTTENPSEAKVLLDNLHFRKIDLADQVHVINTDGYIGHSTSNEMHYAAWSGKTISFAFPTDTVDPEIFKHVYDPEGSRECTWFGCGAWDNLRTT